MGVHSADKVPSAKAARWSYLSHLECARCTRTYSADELRGTCECGGVLLCRYRTDDLKRDVRREDLVGRPATLWRYHELLPAQDADRVVTLGEGSTPLVPLKWGAHHGLGRLVVKDEGQNPTGTFKARGAAVGVTRLCELGVREVVVSSSGNAGDAWAVYTKRAGIKATIILPDDVPVPMLAEAMLAAHKLYTFGGHNRRGGGLANAFAASHGVFCPNTFQEPYRAEGKKTMGLELAEQLGWRMPDVVLYPIGGGVGLVGIWKAFKELLELGWIQGSLPRFYVAQYEGCAPIVDAFRNNRPVCEPWAKISTPPGGLRAPKPAADYLILQILRETNGGAIAVSVEDAFAAVREVMATDGMFLCPEAGTTLVALGKLIESGEIGRDENVAVINTGNGLKYASLFSGPVDRIADDAEVIER